MCSASTVTGYAWLSTCSAGQSLGAVQERAFGLLSDKPCPSCSLSGKNYCMCPGLLALNKQRYSDSALLARTGLKKVVTQQLQTCLQQKLSAR